MFLLASLLLVFTFSLSRVIFRSMKFKKIIYFNLPEKTDCKRQLIVEDEISVEYKNKNKAEII